MAEQKLGAITYADPNGTGQPIEVKGHNFPPNQAVNVNDLFPEHEAEQLKKDLANNPHFRVEGGPDHSKILEARSKHDEAAQKHRQEVAEKQGRAQQQPPPDWKGPEKPSLEHGPSSTKRK
jgi:hypothetical protein